MHERAKKVYKKKTELIQSFAMKSIFCKGMKFRNRSMTEMPVSSNQLTTKGYKKSVSEADILSVNRSISIGSFSAESKMSELPFKKK